MPIYLDRHDFAEKFTREEILEKHRRDVEVGQKYGVRFVAYWCDVTEGVAFCLMDAPSAELAAAVHRESHGAVANRIIQVDPDQVAHFFGRVLSPNGYWENALRIILVAAIEGSTALIERLGDDQARALLRIHDDLVHEALAAHGGRLARRTGDGLVAVFDSVVRALHCAAMIQDAIAAHNARAGAAPIRMRIGLSAGEPVTEHGDLFGAAVDLAARICEFCAPEKVVVSAVVHDLCVGKIFRWTDLGARALRGLAEPVRLYEMCGATDQRSEPGTPRLDEAKFSIRPGLADGAGATYANDARGTIARAPGNLFADAPTLSVEPGGSGAAPMATRCTSRPNVFRREGEYWTIIYEGAALRLKDTKGLRYLSELVHNPGREFHAIELVSAVRDSARPAATGSLTGSEPPISVDRGDAGSLLDRQARSEYRTRLDDLRQELEEADRFNDLKRASLIREEIEFITHELASAVGLGGRYRKAGSPAERARVNATRTITDALKRISEHNPALGLHFGRTIRTGTFCFYAPDPRVPVAWQL